MKYTTLSPEEIKTQVYQEIKKQFLKRGIDNTEMKQIAQTVGIGRTTLYRYFPQKEQLAFSVALELIQELYYPQVSKGIMDELNGFDWISRYCENFIQALISHRESLQFFSEFDRMFMNEMPDIPEAVAYGENNNQNLITISKQIERGQKDGSIRGDKDPLIIAAILTNSIMALAQRTLMRNLAIEANMNLDDTRIIRITTDMLLASIKA